jgi:ureidoglycolate lyase
MIRAQPLSVEAFAPYGDVISAALNAGSSANHGSAVRFDRCAPLVNSRPGTADANLAVFRSAAKSMPFEVKLLEQHPCSTQVFLPMQCTRFLICVAGALDGGAPDVAGLRAFVCHSGQGVAYKPGVWHHPIIALDDVAEFAMIAFEDGTPADCVEYPLAHSVMITE